MGTKLPGGHYGFLGLPGGGYDDFLVGWGLLGCPSYIFPEAFSGGGG